MKINKFKQVAAFCLAFIISMCIYIQPVYAEYSGWGPVTHVGKYYYKYNYNNERLYISTKKNGKYRKTTVNSSQFSSNGKEIMFVGSSKGRYCIKSYRIKSKKTKIIKKLPKTEYRWDVSAAQGRYLWLEDCTNLYRFNSRNKKLKMVKRDAFLHHLKGTYYFCRYGKEVEREIKTDFGEAYLYRNNGAIYRTTKNGKLKLIKNLGEVCGYSTIPDAYVINQGKLRKVLYISSDAHTVYCIDYNGKNKKEIVKFDDAIVYDIASDSCYFIRDGISYKYTYKTGNIEEDA